MNLEKEYYVYSIIRNAVEIHNLNIRDDGVNSG